jgi:hypothetical protein
MRFLNRSSAVCGLGVVCLVGLLMVLPTSAQAAQLPTAEQAKIERLIEAVQRLGDAAFIRNGVSYSAATAVRFLRGKWQTRRGKVLSAEDFIDQVASCSSTTGQPYYIRFGDGRQLPSARFFRSCLSGLEKEKP